jgi:aryl sulfotransferase
MRRYKGFMSDSARLESFTFRADDVVISTPSKCGTTWMQTIVGMLLLGRVDLGAPISTISPWLDMLTRSEDEVFALLEAQTHRRFMKTHSPLDGVPRSDGVTYLTVIRHPLDVAMSDMDHRSNIQVERAIELRVAAVGEYVHEGPRSDAPPEDPADFLRWFIDNDREPTGSGPYGLKDFCNQACSYWSARSEPNVHLFHYTDMWNDLNSEMRRVAEALAVVVDEEDLARFVDAASLSSMRSRATDTAPEAHVGMWRSPEQFFQSGGTRDWASLLSAADLSHFEDRLWALAGDATPWILSGRSALAC